jgi:pyruvate dehydrogenase E2 component (dihydrolipoamide acetyltransferase)
MEIKREKLTKIRKTIGDNLMNSLITIPHATISTTVDMTDLIDLRKARKADGENLSITAFIMKAVERHMEEFPIFNCRCEGDEVIYYDQVNAGVAVDSPRGLMVINVPDVQKKSVAELTGEMRERVANLKAGKITMEDISGSTFTISNEVMSTNDFFNSIINNNECFIIGLARYKKQLVVNDDDSTSIRQIANIILNFNHRMVDGMGAAAFLGKIAETLCNPAQLLD